MANLEATQGRRKTFWIGFLLAWVASLSVSTGHADLFTEPSLSPVTIIFLAIGALPVAFVISSAYAPIPAVWRNVSSPLRLHRVVGWTCLAMVFIPSTILLTWIYNRSQGSILAVGIAHIATNLAGKYLFPITVGSLTVQMLVALVLINIDRMWIRTPQDLPAYAAHFPGDRSPAII